MLKKGKNKELDYNNLNSIIKTGNKLIKLVFYMIVITVVLLGTYLVKEWKLLGFIKELLVVISPIFVGLLIAWLFEPLVTTLQRRRFLDSLVVF